MTSSRFGTLLDIVTTCAVLAASLSIGWSALTLRTAPVARPADAPLPRDPVSISSGVRLGSSTARIVVLEYTDFQCPYCSQFAREVFPLLREKYVNVGTVAFIFRNFPLPMHKDARTDAALAVCAGAHDRFWQVHDLLFRSPSLASSLLREYERKLNLDPGAMDECVNGPGAKQVQADIASGQALGVASTPTFFFGVLEKDGRMRVRQRLLGAGGLG